MLFGLVKCWFGFHDGPVVDFGEICIRKILGDSQLAGKWKIRKCERCGELFSRSDDNARKKIVRTKPIRKNSKMVSRSQDSITRSKLYS